MSLSAQTSLEFSNIRGLYAAGIHPAEVIELIYDRIEACGDPGIFISLLSRLDALKAAKSLGAFDPAKPLWGIPFAIKDNIDMSGLPTSAACPAFAYEPSEDAFAVSLLRQAGAVAIGKTNLDQFATGLVGVRTPYPVPHNAFNSKMVPGGSSSGSAVAVSRGLVSFALGTDTAGSGRVPAGLNNVIGLKPSLGLVSARGVVPACRTLDTISIFALTASNAFEVLQAAGQYDAADAYSKRYPSAMMASWPSRVRIGIPDVKSRKFGGDQMSAKAFEQAVSLASGLGAELVEVDLAFFYEAARLLYDGPWVAERFHATRAQLESQPESLLDVTRRIVSGASRFAAVDLFDAQYRLAHLRRAVQPIWDRIDALMVPTYPRPRTLADLAADPIGPNSELGTYTNFVNLLDQCGIAVPSIFREDGFPSGITLLAPAGRDAFLAGMARELHRTSGVTLGATGQQMPAREPAPAVAMHGELELVVVGAHLSGMALNPELLQLGARFLRSVATKPVYKLFALPGGPPHKPGLLRSGTGGSPIDTEVWAMRPEAFAAFVAAIPFPLGVGNLMLADGTSPKGFLVEACAVQDAPDISHFGGWRAYISSLAA